MTFNYDEPRQIKPMRAKRATVEMLNENQFYAQFKYNGCRMIPIRSFANVKMMGRSWINDFADRYPLVVEDLLECNGTFRQFVIDGELVFFDPKTGKDVFFTALAKPETVKDYTAILVVFDILYSGHIDVRTQSLDSRMELLRQYIPRDLKYVKIAPVLSYVANPDIDYTLFHRFYDWVMSRGAEGLMMKHPWGHYVEGSTSGWYKIKPTEPEDCICVGYTQGKSKFGEEGIRVKTFGAMMLAQYNQAGELVYVGKSSGFTNAQLYEYAGKMAGILVEEPSVVNPKDAPNDVFWCEPKIVVEVEILGKSRYGKFMSSNFLRERDDKPMEECVIVA